MLRFNRHYLHTKVCILKINCGFIVCPL